MLAPARPGASQSPRATSAESVDARPRRRRFEQLDGLTGQPPTVLQNLKTAEPMQLAAHRRAMRGRFKHAGPRRRSRRTLPRPALVAGLRDVKLCTVGRPRGTSRSPGPCSTCRRTRPGPPVPDLFGMPCVLGAEFDGVPTEIARGSCGEGLRPRTRTDLISKASSQKYAVEDRATGRREATGWLWCMTVRESKVRV